MLVIPPDYVLTALLGLGGALALGLLLATVTSKSRKNVKSQIHSLSTTHWLLGDLQEFGANADRMHDWLTEKTLQFNGEPWIIRLSPLMANWNVFTDPAHIEDITATQFDNFARGERQIQVVEDLFGRSMPASDGDRWYHQRKASARFFTAKALRVCMMSFMRKNMTQMYGVVDKSIATGKPIDMIKFFSDFALQTFSELGLGVDLKLIESAEQHPLDHVIENVTPTLIRRTRLPAFYWKLERYLGIGKEGDVTREMVDVRTWLGKVVDDSLAAARQRQADRQAGNLESSEVTETKSVVELFLEQSSEDKEGLRAGDLVDFILSFLLAARGTSATSLQWIFLVISKHPEVEKRIREEMAVMLPQTTEESYITSDDVHKLVYLEATIRESLRLYPTIPLNHREAVKDTLVGGKYFVKKGDLVAIPPYVMARMTSIWGPDAAEFKPERWIDQKTGELVANPNFKFTTFSSGPRMCIGMKLAMIELRVATANLLSRYKFALAEPNDLSYVVSIELMTKTPVMMSATKLEVAKASVTAA